MLLRKRIVFSFIRSLRRSSSIQGAISMSFNRVGEVTDQLPLVIGHGLFGQKTNWNSVSKALNKRLNAPIYLIDFRNHGESEWTDEHTYDLMAEDLERFVENVVLKETGQSQLNLLGHSMGGKAVSLFATQKSKQHFINKLIVEDIAPTRSSSLQPFLGYVKTLRTLDLNKERRQILIDLEKVVPELKVRQFLLTNLIADPSEPGRFKWKVNLAGIEKSLQHIVEFKLKNGSFTGPTLFLYGTKSDFIREADKAEIKHIFSNVTFKSMNTGHWLHAEDAPLFIDHVVDFLSSN